MSEAKIKAVQAHEAACAQPLDKSKDWSETFGGLACKTAHLMGKPAAFLIACALVVIWAASGPLFGFQ